ncbi:hypothetical protein BASA61_006636 [Batrachochytrium salamandrivorans]|nr:hypothetical protein BASA62_000009 [Batrachochytrium salamandrivorans]KAH6560295.1 hypothetical protein BASA60_000008 [Batrachochytrium salamandrivorans]KAH6586047.1 hypothetical protein BASA61_006636 [Batrachochytrium salamandrivorans]KAH9246260.1 hypothetical protein BASA81_016215 [Batrachochytrium salamandrivorans]KAJ1342344.1 hypothetical protein BSLG_003103 [Batrachochytrium salamandrivorans]
MARSLLTSADTSRWKAALESYAYALDTLAATKKKPASGLDLVQLDEWRRGLDSTSELDKAAVLRIVQWKLRRGTFRPTLLAAVASNSEKTILTATTAAKLLLSQTSSSCKHPSTSKILDAIKVVSELTGVGPATASAILACSSDRVPFMSDEALVALQGTDPAKLKYTIKQYTELLTVLTEKAAELNHAAASSSTASTAVTPLARLPEWSPRSIECALWACQILHKHQTPPSATPTSIKKATSIDTHIPERIDSTPASNLSLPPHIPKSKGKKRAAASIDPPTTKKPSTSEVGPRRSTRNK